MPCQKTTNKIAMNKNKTTFLFCCLLISSINIFAQQTNNKPDREQWFMDLGFGMFVHWSFDSQVGSVISHSMAGASDDYLYRFINELPKTFNPKKFDPDEWAVLAKLAGMKYIVFTAKHHSGFCMWNTKTTKFGIMNTPFKRDIVKEVIEAFRKQDIAIGLYFSPEDFNLLYENDIPIGRLQHPLHYPINNKKLMDLDKAQIKELLTNYGKIDVLFFDGPAEELKEYAWQLQSNIVVTRGQMQTPEQTLPNKSLPGPWEACFTMGTDWQYKATNDPHKSGSQIINMLIETRAKGGNLLLNVGPKPNGEIQIEQEALLREIALWNLINTNAIHDIRPWEIIKEEDIWFTASKDEKTVYAFVQGGKNWGYAKRKEIILKQIKTTSETKISVLGYASELVEYRSNIDANVYFHETPIGLIISAVNGHRMYTNNQWPNPVVLKLENVKFKSIEEVKNEQSEIDGAQ